MNIKKVNFRIPKDELRYLLFSEIYFNLEEAKAKRKALELINSAIKVISRKGFDQLTLEMIAREAGITRPLLKHYFKDLEDIKMISMKYVRVIFQKMVIESLDHENNPKKMLINHLLKCFEWVEKNKTHAIVWLAFLHKSATTNAYKQLNTSAVQTGEERLVAILNRGKNLNEFKCSDPVRMGKFLQVVITGGLLSFVSEEISDPEGFKSMIIQECLNLVSY